MAEPQETAAPAPPAWPDERSVWFDARGLQRGFKEHAGRGIGTYVACLALALDGEAAEGRVRLLVERGSELIASVPASRLLAAPSGLPGSGRLATQLRQHAVLAAWISAREPAAVHFAAQTDAPAWVGVPSLVTVHDVFLHRLPREPGARPPFRFRVARALERLAIRRAARLVVPSRVTAHELAETLGVPAAKIAVIPYAARAGFDPAPVESDAAVRSRLRLPERYLLHPGGADARKRLPELVAAFDAVARDDAGLHLVLAGPVATGTGAPPVLSAIASARARDRIALPGVLDDRDMPAVYRGALAVVLATRHEGFGFPVVEAFASGVPVVATAAPAIAEIASDAARLVPVDRTDALADAIRDVLRDPALAAELRARGLRRAAQHRWSVAASETLQIYEEITGRPLR
ncbi:MAG TPA: glycosyltransferase family 1 protein [Candidatus Binatia bacterium]|nr:glycosyltransferase family 1 protein [Candidatus Binatia bacterium]